MKNIFDLDGEWQLAGFDVGEGNWQQVEVPYPISASVPGEVHLSLLEAGLIKDPYTGFGDEDSRWVENQEWWYKTSFTLPADFLKSQTFIEFDGLDTYADLLLNGERLGSSQNMFIPYRFDVTGKVKEEEENTLEVRFSPVKNNLKGRDLERLNARYTKDRLGARRMQASFGWDWMPRLLGCGIWRDVSIKSYDRLSISDVFIQPVVVYDKGRLFVNIEVGNHVPVPVDAVLAIRISGGAVETAEQEVLIPTSGTVIEAVVDIDNPQLWWPNGYGEQTLYSAVVEVRSGSDVLDSKETRFAFRTIELHERNEQDEPAFYFAVNGEKIFVKGANWISADAFPSKLDTATYRRMLTLAKDSYYNMVRVWGGGIYEKPEFYELCDELGIMVWQDFMFSLAEYPSDDDFINEVSNEVHSVIRELRNHPSIALWCGNNECELDVEEGTTWAGKRLFHEVIPEIVWELDPSCPYWPTSPYGGKSAHSPEYGDYHGEPWFHTAQEGASVWREWIPKDAGLFMSETPTQGPPEIESLRKFIPEDQIFPAQGPVWEKHNQLNAHRQQRSGMSNQEALNKLIDEMAGHPSNIEEYCYLGGVLQGDFLRSQIEYYRRKKFSIGGCMVWVFDEPYPSVSYSLVDYYHRPKPAYYFVKRAYAPIAVVFDQEGDDVIAWVINDRKYSISGTVHVSWVSLDTNGVQTELVDFNAPANGVVEIWRGEVPVDLGTQILVGRVEVGGKLISRSSYYFDLLKNVAFPKPEISMQKSYEDGRLQLTLSSGTFAHALKINGLPDSARPADDYFDILPGETRSIVIADITEEQAEEISIMSYESGVMNLETSSA